MSPVWLEEQMTRLRAAFVAGRMPHALLIHEAPGAGGEWLAYWAAQLVLCAHPQRAPCGDCPACGHVARRQHPDLMVLGPQERSTQIRIEQVREFAADLSLTAHQGGYKVGVLSPADSMNRFAANALLKTLEEPPPRSLMALVASVPSRLPATILSRCQRLRVPPPSRALAVQWLTDTRGPADWQDALAVLGNAPFIAATLDPATIAQTAREMRHELEQFAGGSGDPAGSAERWARSEPALRLTCFENWITERIRRGLLGEGAVAELRASTHSGASGLTIRGAFELLDGVRELRSSLDAPINRGVALEALLRRMAPRAAA